MEDHHHDKVFFVTFTGVLAFLIGLTVVIVTIANVLVGDEDVAMDPVMIERTAQRLQPVGQVYTDASQIAAAPAAAPAKARSAGEIVDGVCAACHASGVLGATKLDDAAGWKTRMDAAGGLEGLVSSAVAGKNAMPPKGGDASLTEADIKAAVEEMLKRAGL